MTGETTPDAGSIELFGQPIKTYTPAAAHAIGFHMVHQELAVFENLTVAENIYPYYNHVGKISYRKLYEKAQAQLDLLGIQTIRPDAPLASVPLAGQQMVEILRCIAAKPQVLILDEPTSGLNDAEVELLMGALRSLRREGLTIVYISHRLKEIMRISDRVTVLRDGEYVTTLTNDGRLAEDELINCMVGRSLNKNLYSIKTSAGVKSDDILFEARGLYKKNALQKTDLRLRESEIVGVFGLEGSGANRLSRILYGLERKDGGKVLVKGREIPRAKPTRLAHKKVLYLNNNRKVAGLLPDISVSENISLPILKHISGTLGFLRFKDLEQTAREFVCRFSVSLPSLSTHPRNLSGGNQQKVMLSMCLAPLPEVLIANEPPRGIDVSAKAEIHDFLLDIAQKGVGILLFSSELPELMKLSDRILVMRNHSIVHDIPCEEFSEQTIMRYAAVDMVAST
jgi:ABC-type sugar transport system ATPase subunit